MVGLQTFDIRFRCMGCNRSRARSSPTWAGVGSGHPTWRASHARGKGLMGSCQSPFSTWSLPLGEKPGLRGWGAGFQPLLRDSFHMWLWMSQFPLWNSGLPSPQGRSRAGWVHRYSLGTSHWGELLRLQKDKKTSPQPSGHSNLPMPGTFTYSFFPPKHVSFVFSHYESSSCLLFKKYIQKTQQRKTKAEMIPTNLTCPETTTVSTVVYILPDRFL